MMLLPVILAGGTGSRLWPLSRELFPKQFLPLTGDNSMLHETLVRLTGLDAGAPLVVCNEEHRFIAAEQMQAIGALGRPILLEPVARNTAPAIALAALQATAGGEDPILLVLPADHLIDDPEGFRAAVRAALDLAGAGRLVTFGIVPSAPETGYGYIRRGADLGGGAFAVDRFVEKPDRAAAEGYLASGDHSWNAGIFLFRASRYLEELGRHRPDILAACRAAMAASRADLDFIRPDAAAFAACPTESIDYAVMERTTGAAVFPIDVGWSDVGTWAALWAALGKDGDQNVTHGTVFAKGSRRSYAYAETGIIALVGVEDIIVVQTKDAVLVAHRDAAQDVKDVVAALKSAGRSEHHIHREVYRPWGKYDSVDQGGRYQVKRITVKPGAKLSLQMHHHRAEHWVVVSGTASVTRGDEVLLVTENQSVYLPLGTVHALENPGKIPLELIEVQSGSYLGEDDIRRFEDRYGRV